MAEKKEQQAQSQAKLASEAQQALSGQRVLITRPAHQQPPLITGLQVRGAKTISLPLLAITAPSRGEQADVLRRQLLALDSYELLVFISSNAVREGCKAIDDYWPQFPVGLDLLAIGPSTAALAEELTGQRVRSAAGGMTSEDLLELDSFTNIEGRRIGIFRGEGGRDFLAQQLRKRGAQVDYFDVYRREELNYEDIQVREALIESEPTLLTAMSGQTLQALRSLIDQLSEPHADKLLTLPVIVPSQRVRDLAAEMGFENPIAAPGADLDALLQALVAAAGKESSIEAVSQAPRPE
jgi:uroporphyrinogen-III synthase